MELARREYVLRNCLTFVYKALRSKDRFIGETSTSPYEDFFSRLSDALSTAQKKIDGCATNSEVESFYLGRVSLGEFRLHCQKRIFSKVQGLDFDTFAELAWHVCSTDLAHSELCHSLPPSISRQMWEMFIWLDVDSQEKIHLEDLCDLIQRILKENGHFEPEQNIREWFCEETTLDFWSFYAVVVEKLSRFMKANIIQQLHKLITTEEILSSKLTKKGHKRHSWKERWFLLQPTQMTYYESRESKALKGMITIGKSSTFDFLPDTKSHMRRVKVVDSSTQVAYEICCPDNLTLQQWSNGIMLAITMNQLDGRNFLHKLTMAQKMVFPGHSNFTVNAISPSTYAAPTSESSMVQPTPTSPHRTLASTTSVPISYQTVEKQRVRSSTPPLLAATSLSKSLDCYLNGPPPIPEQRFVHPSVSKSATHTPELPPRTVHMEITRDPEVPKEEVKKANIEHVTVGCTKYAVVSRVKKTRSDDASSNTNTNTTPRPQLSLRDTLNETERPPAIPRRSSPQTPRKGYANLVFENGGKIQSPSTPGSLGGGPIPKDVRTKWGYTTIVFEQDKEKEREFEAGYDVIKVRPQAPAPYNERERELDSAGQDSRKPRVLRVMSPNTDERNKGLTKYTSESAVQNPNSGRHMHRKPDSLPDLKQQRCRFDYADVDFLKQQPQNDSPQNNRGGGGGGGEEGAGHMKTVSPVLPLKESPLYENKDFLNQTQSQVNKTFNTTTTKPQPLPRQKTISSPEETHRLISHDIT